jgi:hypothetical protein
MPYIAKELRKLIDCGSKPDNPGELNYLITCLCRDYIEQKGKRYLILNEVVGALECAKLELYRRVAAPYEDEKIAENGDVYPVS